MAMHDDPRRTTVSLWSRAGDTFIVGSALLSLLGWTLALSRQLKPVPYHAGLAGVLMGLAWMYWRRGGERRSWRTESPVLRRLFRRPIIVVYTLIWLAGFIGGALYAPSYYDALSYRTPQLLHWIADGGWHWIETSNSRMNIAPPGFNWLASPFLFVTGSDRPFFLVNVACFTLLPGFIFEMLWRAGVSRRVARDRKSVV